MRIIGQLRTLAIGLHSAIDRVTGDVAAIFTSWSGKTIYTQTKYSLKCRPAQRMF
jgi:hypothetical protein